MYDTYSRYRDMESRMLAIGKFFGEIFRQTINKTGRTEKLDFSMLELKGLSAFLDFNKEYTISELSSNARLPRPNMTFIINRLEKKGIVKRARDKQDKRVVNVRLTASGKKLFAKFIQKRVEEFENTLGRLSKQDQKELVDILERASEILQKVQAPQNHEL